MRGLMAAITPNAKKTARGNRIQQKKSRNMRKKGLLKFFWEGPCVPAPFTEAHQ
jgi:hypothetical protein